MENGENGAFSRLTTQAQTETNRQSIGLDNYLQKETIKMRYPNVSEEEYMRVTRAIAGRIGGRKKSPRKRAACKLNGLLGGRPRKRQLELPLGLRK